VALLVSAAFMLLSVFVSVLSGNDSALAALLISFIITFLVGVFPFIFVRSSAEISLKEGYVIIALSWLLSFVFGMLPYALWGGPFTLQNAWFESVSGFTTCGATILNDVEALPRSLLFWRSSTHFIGGLGVVVFLLLIIPGSSPMRMRLINMELTSLSRNGYSSRPNKVVQIFASVYLSLLALAFLAYMAVGMKPFDAICHAMSVTATGGFSTRNASIAYFNSFGVEAVTVIFMYLSSLHFGLLFLAVVSRSLKPLRSPVLKFYTLSIVVISLLIAVGIKTGDSGSTWWSAVWDGLFSTLSVSSTTGFAVRDNAGWSPWMIMLLVFAGVMCGSAGSTSSGIKADRVLVLFKSVARYIGNILHPSSVNELRLGKRVLRDEEIYPHLLYVGVYFLLILLSTLLCLCVGMDGEASFVSSVMSLGDVGPACGELGTMGSYDSVPPLAKLILSLDMFLGRVEVYPVLAAVGMFFDKRRR